MELAAGIRATDSAIIGGFTGAFAAGARFALRFLAVVARRVGAGFLLVDWGTVVLLVGRVSREEMV